jgi:hypothetical protein
LDPARQDPQAYPTREGEAYSVSRERASAEEIRLIGIYARKWILVYLVSPAGPDMPVSTAEPTLVRTELQDELSRHSPHACGRLLSGPTSQLAN